MSNEEPKVIVYAVDDFGSIARRLAELQEEAERNRRIFEQAQAMLEQSKARERS